VPQKRILIKLGILFILFTLNLLFAHPDPVSKDDRVPARTLELKFFFPGGIPGGVPGGEINEKEIYLDRPQRISSGESGQVYFSCMGSHSIFKFNDEGRFIREIGRAGQGPGEFQGPNHVVPWRDKLIVLDNFSRKIQILDSEGKYLSSFIIQSTYWDLVVSKSGLIYAAPLLHSYPGKKETALIHVYDQQGELTLTFGTPKINNSTVFNMVRLAIDHKNEIYAAYTHWPEIRKYTSDGKLIAEYTIEHLLMAERAKFNRKQLSKPKKVGEPGFSQTCIDDIEVLGDRIFLFLRSYVEPRLEFLEFDQEMNRVNKYLYKPKDQLYGIDFFVKTNGENLLFYFLDRSEYRIIVLAEKK